jgi:molybdopterin/thiamine biosynthesis adenylyltransferase
MSTGEEQRSADLERDAYIEGMLDRTLRFFSRSDVDTVRNTCFAISGLGGVGAITAELLARWGVKRFRLLDMDKYEPSNLNRQLFSLSQTLGRPKVEVAAERILAINPYAEIEMKVAERVNNENVDAFISGAGMSIQNADHPSCKLFYTAARKHKVPLVNGHATITGGRIQSFDYRTSSCESNIERWWNERKLKNEKALETMSSDEIENFDNRWVHATAPSVNYVVNMVGCFIVSEAIKMLTGKGKAVTYPRYLGFDTFKNTMRVGNILSPFDVENIGRLRSMIKGMKPF